MKRFHLIAFGHHRANKRLKRDCQRVAF
ncbi:hypothetical protein CGT77_18140, partial [Vibrio cholerae]